jgi:UPF0271 protein
VSDKELHALILYQVGALKSMTEALGGKLQHVKPHGALYNDLALNFNQSLVVAEVIYKIDNKLIFIGLANSQMTKAAQKVGLKVANEVFADRAYNDDGSLVARSQPGAVFHDINQSLGQVYQMIKHKSIQSINGKNITLQGDTICVHGDNQYAIEFVSALNTFFQENGIERRSLSQL